MLVIAYTFIFLWRALPNALLGTENGPGCITEDKPGCITEDKSGCITEDKISVQSPKVAQKPLLNKKLELPNQAKASMGHADIE